MFLCLLCLFVADPLPLFFDVTFEHLATDNSSVHVSFIVDADALCAGMVGYGRFRVLDKSSHATVTSTADANTLLDS